MKKFLAITLAITTVILSMTALTVSADTVEELQGNLFQNGTMESETLASVWKSCGGMTTDVAHTGSTSAKAGSLTGSGIRMYQEVTLEKGKSYTYSLWAKGIEAAGDRILVCPYIEYVKADEKDASNPSMKPYYTANDWKSLSTGEWMHITNTITIPSDWEYPSTTLRVGLNSDKSTYYIDDMFLGILEVTDLAITASRQVGSSGSNAKTIYKWDADSLTIDHSKETSNGYTDPVELTIAFVNQIGTTPVSTEEWKKIQWTCSTNHIGDSYALRSINTATAPFFRFTYAPNGGGRTIEDFSMTAVYTPSEGTPITKVFSIRHKLNSWEVSLSDGTTTIKQGEALQNGTFTPSFTLYNKSLGWKRYMCLSALYEQTEQGIVLKDIVISTGNTLDQGWTKSSTTTADDTLTITNAEKSYVKSFIWNQGDGSSPQKPVWSLKPILEAAVIQ